MCVNHGKIADILRRYSQCGADYGITHQTRIEGDLGLDSLDRIEIGQKLEETFGIDIPDDDLDAELMGTFGGICEYIDGRLAQDA